MSRRPAGGPWRNWAGNQIAPAATVAHPSSIDEAAALVVAAGAAGRRVKAVGAGHSFSAVGRPEELAVELDRMAGVRSVDWARGLVTVGAGTSLATLNRDLAGMGRALANLGDIETQTVAGAISTGTHGTGAGFGGLATFVTGLELVTATGSVLSCSATGDAPAGLDAAIWPAARLSLGALGVITEVTLQTVPLFALRAEESPMGLADLLDRFDDLMTADHFEAYWWPHTKRTFTKRNTRLPLGAEWDPLSPTRTWWEDEVLANRVFGWTTELGRRRPAMVAPANRLAAAGMSRRTYTDLSYRVFTTPRRVRFKEMEYAIPRAEAPAAIAEVVRAVEGSGLRVGFPVELRVAAGDDLALSTASGGPRAYLAFHVPAAARHEAYFSLVAGILDGYGGRPHWGKLHTLDAATLRARYPRFDEFVAVRDALDPSGRFANRYLDRVLGPAPLSPAALSPPPPAAGPPPG